MPTHGEERNKKRITKTNTLPSGFGTETVSYTQYEKYCANCGEWKLIDSPMESMLGKLKQCCCDREKVK